MTFLLLGTVYKLTLLLLLLHHTIGHSCTVSLKWCACLFMIINDNCLMSIRRWYWCEFQNLLVVIWWDCVCGLCIKYHLQLCRCIGRIGGCDQFLSSCLFDSLIVRWGKVQIPLRWLPVTSATCPWHGRYLFVTSPTSWPPYLVANVTDFSFSWQDVGFHVESPRCAKIRLSCRVVLVHWFH